MKKLTFFSILFTLTGILAFSQSPESFSYQAVLRDESGQIIKNRDVSVRITLLQGSAEGTVVYTETFSVTTNDYGIITLQVGTGETADDFSSVDWSDGPYFLRISVDPEGGTAYVEMGTFQLLSVPYALHAKTAENVFSGDYKDLANTPDLSIYLTTETDPQVGNNILNYFPKWDGTALVAGNLYDTGSQVGTTVPIMANGGISTPSLTLGGVSRSYWNKGAAPQIPYWARDDSLGLTNLFFHNGKTGIGTKYPATALDVAGAGRFSDSLFAGNLLKIGHNLPWRLFPVNDTLFSMNSSHNTGAGLMLEASAGRLGGFYADTGKYISLFGPDNNTVWFSRTYAGAAGNISLRNGNGPSDGITGYGTIEYARNRFYLTVPDNALKVVSFRIGSENVADIDRGGVLSIAALKDKDNSLYGLDPSGNSRLSSLLVMGTVTATNAVSQRFLDYDDNSYWADPAGSSRLNQIYTRKIIDMDNSIFYLDPNDTSYCRYLEAISLKAQSYLGAGRFTDTDDNSYYVDPNKQTALYELRVNSITGLGGPPSGTYRLYVYGKAYSTGGWASSDIRWKKDITPLSNELNKILSLQGVKYHWRKNEYPDMGFDNREHIGLIAQEVEKVFPDLVSTDQNGYKAVSYEKLTVVLLEALKEQQKMIDDQQKHLKELEQKVEKLKE